MDFWRERRSCSCHTCPRSARHTGRSAKKKTQVRLLVYRRLIRFESRQKKKANADTVVHTYVSDKFVVFCFRSFLGSESILRLPGVQHPSVDVRRGVLLLRRMYSFPHHRLSHGSDHPTANGIIVLTLVTIILVGLYTEGLKRWREGEDT